MNAQHTTHGIVHAGFIGFRRFVARKKGWCKLIRNRFVIPHDTIPSNVRGHCLQIFFDSSKMVCSFTVLFKTAEK